MNKNTKRILYKATRIVCEILMLIFSAMVIIPFAILYGSDYYLLNALTLTGAISFVLYAIISMWYWGTFQSRRSTTNEVKHDSCEES